MPSVTVDSDPAQTVPLDVYSDTYSDTYELSDVETQRAVSVAAEDRTVVVPAEVRTVEVPG